MLLEPGEGIIDQHIGVIPCVFGAILEEKKKLTCFLHKFWGMYAFKERGVTRRGGDGGMGQKRN